MNKVLKKAILILVIVGILFSFTGCTTYIPNIIEPNNSSYTLDILPSSLDTVDKVNVSTTYTTADREESNLSLVEAIAKVNRSVVAVYVTSGSSTGAGAGIIVDMKKEGDSDNIFYVLTAHHVVEYENCKVSVAIPDKDGKNYLDDGYDKNYYLTGVIGGTDESGKIDKSLDVSFVGGDKYSDVALLRLNIKDNEVAKNIVKAKIMDTRYGVTIGERVFAIGNPTGVLPGTCTTGTISYVYRTTSVSSIGNMTLYQLDVNSYHGSSGGGLFNMYGELVGITNSGDDDNIGINYAVPIKITDDKTTDMGFYNIATQLLGTYSDTNYGYISGRKVKFGFTVQKQDDGSSKIISVNSSSLAESAGLVANDVIKYYKINDGPKLPADDYTTTNNAIAGLTIGDKITLTVLRNGFRSVDVTLTCYQYYFCNTGK